MLCRNLSRKTEEQGKGQLLGLRVSQLKGGASWWSKLLLISKDYPDPLTPNPHTGLFAKLSPPSDLCKCDLLRKGDYPSYKDLFSLLILFPLKSWPQSVRNLLVLFVYCTPSSQCYLQEGREGSSLHYTSIASAPSLKHSKNSTHVWERNGWLQLLWHREQLWVPKRSAQLCEKSGAE